MSEAIQVHLVCETSFNPGEYDLYQWIPKNPEVSNHRLTLRKNPTSNEYEIYRHYAVQVTRELIIRGQHVTVQQQLPLGREEVVFRSFDLQEALDFASQQVARFHGHNEEFKVCQHDYPNISAFCQKWVLQK